MGSLPVAIPGKSKDHLSCYKKTHFQVPTTDPLTQITMDEAWILNYIPGKFENHGFSPYEAHKDMHFNHLKFNYNSETNLVILQISGQILK